MTEKVMQSAQGTQAGVLSQPKTVSSSGPLESQTNEPLPWPSKQQEQETGNIYKMPESVQVAHQGIRDKLDKLRLLFEEEDENQKAADMERYGLQSKSSEWDMQGHRIMYQEAMDKRKRHLENLEKRRESKGVHGD